MYLKYSKIRDNVQTPSRSNPSDAGLDVFANFVEGQQPKGTYDYAVGGDGYMLQPGQNIVIPTGLKFEIPHGYCLMVCNRSGNASKKSLVYGAHIVDSNYSGEVFIDIHNIGTKAQLISSQDKIAQLIMLPVLTPLLHEVLEEELYQQQISGSNRGASGFGASGD